MRFASFSERAATSAFAAASGSVSRSVSRSAPGSVVSLICAAINAAPNATAHSFNADCAAAASVALRRSITAASRTGSALRAASRLLRDSARPPACSSSSRRASRSSTRLSQESMIATASAWAPSAAFATSFSWRSCSRNGEVLSARLSKRAANSSSDCSSADSPSRDCSSASASIGSSAFGTKSSAACNAPSIANWCSRSCASISATMLFASLAFDFNSSTTVSHLPVPKSCRRRGKRVAVFARRNSWNCP